jgi:hypothetical protein
MTSALITVTGPGLIRGSKLSVFVGPSLFNSGFWSSKNPCFAWVARGQDHYLTATKKNSDTFIAFFEHLLHAYPNQHLILVMDNASYYHSKTVKAALSLY